MGSTPDHKPLILCFPGVTKREQIYGDNPSKTVPDFVMESFGDFSQLLK